MKAVASLSALREYRCWELRTFCRLRAGVLWRQVYAHKLGATIHALHVLDKSTVSRTAFAFLEQLEKIVRREGFRSDFDIVFRRASRARYELSTPVIRAPVPRSLASGARGLRRGIKTDLRGAVLDLDPANHTLL
jgi:hypothetical protein